VELVNTLEKELGEEAADTIKDPKYFVDFMRDAPEPTGEEVSFSTFFISSFSIFVPFFFFYGDQ
jgi:hypothetical protein